MSLTRTVIAGPRAQQGALPRRLDACGHFIGGGPVPWTFETLAGGVPDRPGEAQVATPIWRLRTGFGTTEVGCVVVGLALALARTPGADDAGATLIRRRGLAPGQDLVVVPEVVRTVRPLTELPLAVLITAADDASDLRAALEATTRWSITLARIDPIR